MPRAYCPRMTLKLISFALCPFVQRAVITLKEKGLSPDIEYIDLANKPEWFLKISPRGKVPVLVVDGSPLFESQAIVEYLEDTIPEPALRPSDPVERARDRAWFALASEDLFMNHFRLDHSKDEASVRKALAALHTALDRVEEAMQGRAYLSGDGARFGLADVAMAPFLMRAEITKKRGWVDLFTGRPSIRAWADRVLARETVQTSVRPDFEAESLAAVTRAEAWLVSHPGEL